MKTNQRPFPILLLVRFHWAAISSFSLVIQIIGAFCPFAGCRGYWGTAQPGTFWIPPEEQTPWSDAVLQVEGTDGVGLQFETAMQTLLCIAEPSRANMIVFFSNRAWPKQQFPGASMILGGFPPSQMGEGSREKGRSLVIGAVHATKQQGDREELFSFIFAWE